MNVEWNFRLSQRMIHVSELLKQLCFAQLDNYKNALKALTEFSFETYLLRQDDTYKTVVYPRIPKYLK